MLQRLEEFRTKFEVDLSNFSQDTVPDNNKGNYFLFLTELKKFFKSSPNSTATQRHDIAKRCGIDSPLLNLFKSLLGLNVISKNSGQYFFSNVVVTSDIAEKIFQYNYFRNAVMEQESDESKFMGVSKSDLLEWEGADIGFQAEPESETEEKADDVENPIEQPITQKQEEIPVPAPEKKKRGPKPGFKRKPKDKTPPLFEPEFYEEERGVKAYKIVPGDFSEQDKKEILKRVSVNDYLVIKAANDADENDDIDINIFLAACLQYVRENPKVSTDVVVKEVLQILKSKE